MAFREVQVIEIKEVLRQWLRGHGYREAGRLAQVDRKTARRYVKAGEALGLDRGGGEEQLTAEFVGEVLGRVRRSGPGVHGESWAACVEQRALLTKLIKDGLTLTKAHELLERQVGKPVPYRTLHRFAAEELGFRREEPTVRIDDGEPGQEVQIDFGRLGLLHDRVTGTRRYVHGLVVTATFSRYTFVWLSYQQRVQDVIAGLEAAWRFFGGVFPVVIPDNMKAIVDQADAFGPRINAEFREYAQARGFTVDPARVRKPQDKARVERMVPYVRDNFFAGEDFHALDAAQAAAEVWCRHTAGDRRHGTTRARPREVFEREEQRQLLPVPEGAYDIPIFGNALVGQDHHFSFGEALYSVPTEYIGERVDVKADSQLVRVFHRGRPIKTHPRKAPGGRSTDEQDYPAEVREYASRNAESLQRRATEAGPHVDEYVRRLLAGPAPWMRMRMVYRLLGLVRRYGAERVEEACKRALELDVVDVMRVERMLERALEGAKNADVPAPAGQSGSPRFLRPASDFATVRTPSVEACCDE